MSVIPDITLQACSQKVIGNKAIERRVSAVILNVCQSTGIAKGDGSRQSLENHGKLDENQTFSNKKFGEDHDVHHNMALAEDYSQTTRSGGSTSTYPVWWGWPKTLSWIRRPGLPI